MVLPRTVFRPGAIIIIALVSVVSSPLLGLAQPTEPQMAPQPPVEKAILVPTSSGPSEIALAKHLSQIQAKVYTAFWCPHCHAQLSMFGAEAATVLQPIECDPQGKNAQPQLCQDAKIQGFPTWILKDGRRYAGAQSLGALANATGYKGPRDFQNPITK
jgi:hypothetical protein